MKKLYLHLDKAHNFNLNEVAAYIQNTTAFEPEIEKELFISEEKLEKINIRGLKFPKPVYEGFELERVFRSLIKNKDFHIIFTDKMFATWSDKDKRYHGRTIICSYPDALISTTGIVEAPSRPKEYYAKLIARQYAEQAGIKVPGVKEFEGELKKEFKGRFIDYCDERLTEVLKGYALQAIAFFLTFEAFCEDKNCRLYNAHTQEELINAQLKGRICEKHKKILKSF